MQFSTSIMYSRFLSILILIHCTVARPQGQIDTLTSFLPDNPLGETSGTQLIAFGDTNSDSNLRTQQPWIDDPESILLGGAGCNDVAPNQTPHSRSRRSFTKRDGEICSPDDRNQLLKQAPPLEQGQQPAGDAAQPLPLNPNSVNPDRPGNMQTPPKGVHPDAFLFWNTIYSFPGEDGKPDDEVCATSGNPLLRVPICAPPQPTSPLAIVLPARFCEFYLYFLIIFFFSRAALHTRPFWF